MLVEVAFCGVLIVAASGLPSISSSPLKSTRFLESKEVVCGFSVVEVVVVLLLEMVVIDTSSSLAG